MTREKRLSAKSLCVCWIAALFLVAALPWLAPSQVRAAPANGSQVYFNDFDGGLIVAPDVTATLGGITNVEPVQGYAGLGTGSNTFGGEFLRNATGGDFGSSGPMGTPGSPTTLTLIGLPPHIRIDINFLLAIIDSWDGSESGQPGGCCDPDILSVLVDGKIVFSEAFGYNSPVYDPPPGGLLVEYVPLGFNPGFDDSAYDMGLEPTFDIPHMADTLTVEWFASGDGWQGGMDESWAIDNLEIVLHGGTPVALDVKPQSCPNPVNTKAKGTTLVAVLGTGDLDVTQIDVDSLRLEGVAPIRSAIEDVATPFEPLIGKEEVLDCNDLGPDGLTDLTLKFDTPELVEVLGSVVDGQVRILTLTGTLLDGTPIQGEDVVVILSQNRASPYDDDFSSTTLDPKWHWVREDPTHWNLTDNPGHLRIVTQQRDIWRYYNNAPLLLQTFSADSFEIRTRIVMMPFANYHQGGLVIYGDDDNYVRFTFTYLDGLKFSLSKEIDEDFQSINVPAPNVNSVHLRLRKEGQDYTGDYSQDGKHWINVGQHSNVNITPSEIGLLAFNAVTPIEIPADFDYFKVVTH